MQRLTIYNTITVTCPWVQIVFDFKLNKDTKPNYDQNTPFVNEQVPADTIIFTECVLKKVNINKFATFFDLKDKSSFQGLKRWNSYREYIRF
jgi:hypothetical protein